MVLVPQPASCEHDYACKGGRRRGKQLAGCGVEAEAAGEDNRGEVCQSIADCRRVKEHHGKQPDLGVAGIAEKFAELELRRRCITPIAIHTSDDICPLTGIEKPPVIAFRVGEVDEQPIPKYC